MRAVAGVARVRGVPGGRARRGRPSGLTSRIVAMTCAAVVIAVGLSGLVALGLIRNSYDAQARTVLHRDAVLVARLVDTGAASATRPGRPARRLLTGSRIRVVRVLADGTVQGLPAGGGAGTAATSGLPGSAALDPATAQAAAAGQRLDTTRTVGGTRYFVAVVPVDAGGGGSVVLLQTAADARSVTNDVLRRLGLALVVGLAVAVGVAVLLARRLARPLVRAAEAAHRLGAGERDVRLEQTGPAEVAEVSAGLNALAGALAVSEKRQREFLLSVSHELRTPLTAIRGFAEALRDGVVDGPDAVDAGATILAESLRLERLVTDLLDLARLGADDFRLDRSEVDLAALVRDAGVIWARRCEAAGVPFLVELPPGAVVVATDPGRVRQVLDGLAENALRVTPAGRPIVFALHVEPVRPAPLEPGAGPRSEGSSTAGAPSAVLAVRDGGPGLLPADRAVAFERSALYERYRAIRPVGTGLGLALVGALVTRLGGTVTAEEAPEGGAAFTVRLPLLGDARGAVHATGAAALAGDDRRRVPG